MKTKTKDRIYLLPRYDQFLSEEGFSIYRVIHEGRVADTVALERHYNDLYKFYIRKLGVFEAEPYFDENAAIELKGLFEELVKLKRLFEGGM